MSRIVSVAQMRALEEAAFAAGTSEEALQERAGTAVAAAVAPLVQAGFPVVIVAGPGNNGRDGAVAAGWLADRGVAVDLLVSPRHALRAEELDRLRQQGARVATASVERLEKTLPRATVVVDALLGIGSHGALRPAIADLARTINQISERRGPGLQVLALDIPTGIDADAGSVADDAIWADHTITLGAVKQGLLRFPAAERVGRLVCVDIGLPPSALDSIPFELLEVSSLSALVPFRPLSAHKYHFGRVLAVAGAPQYPGAAYLSAAAAARVGAGLVRLGSHADVRTVVASSLPEAVHVERPISVELDPVGALAALRPHLWGHETLLLGPGLGRGPGTSKFVRALLLAWLEAAPLEASAVIDGDALFALGEWPDWSHWLRGRRVVLTPHAGELTRLMTASGAASREMNEAYAAELAQKWACYLVAKGPVTRVASPDGRVAVWPQPNSALATAGTGDVLAGLCAGLLAQSSHPWDAARLAVGVHALAARRQHATEGSRTLLASDLLPQIGPVLATLASHSGERAPRLH